jgi:hypothetical protein
LTKVAAAEATYATSSVGMASYLLFKQTKERRFETFNALALSESQIPHYFFAVGIRYSHNL